MLCARQKQLRKNHIRDHIETSLNWKGKKMPTAEEVKYYLDYLDQKYTCAWPILELVSQGKASKWKTMILDKDDNPGPGEGGSTSRDDCPTGEKIFS